MDIDSGHAPPPVAANAPVTRRLPTEQEAIAADFKALRTRIGQLGLQQDAEHKRCDGFRAALLNLETRWTNGDTAFAARPRKAGA